MPRFITYRLRCECPRYNESLIPEEALRTVREFSGNDTRVLDFRATSTFWTLSHEPAEVYADAVAHLVARQKEIQRENAEYEAGMCADLYKQYGQGRHLNWDPEELELPDDPESNEVYLRHFNMHLSDAASNYRSMVEGIRLEPVEILSLEESKLIERAARFVRDPERYFSEMRAIQNPHVQMDIQRSIANLKEYVRQRLIADRGMDTDQFKDVAGKALHDLEHYFPVEFEGL
jgi:hypothetical protein